MIKLLIEYANEHNIILEINENNNDGWCPLLNAISGNNIEIVKLLIDYANKHNIVMRISDSNLEEKIQLINNEIITLLYSNKKLEKIKIKHCNNSTLLNKFDEMDKTESKKQLSKEKRIEMERKELENIQKDIELLKIQEEKERLEKELLDLKLNQFKEKLKSFIGNCENNEIINENYYEWKIDNFSDIQNTRLSPEFLMS
eukprot:jgi/Orpsp1_1/1189682/evm.model.d7180000073721.1